VTLTTDPQKWDRDLELVPGTTFTGSLALIVTESVGTYAAWFGSTLIGAALGLVIPLLTVPKAQRRWVDWLAGALTGAAIILTVWASVVVFSVWRRWRPHERSPLPGLDALLVMPALAVVHFAIVVGVCHGLIAWITAGG
jgi:hypothetical protein